jgi:hypothetical protein
MKDITDAAYIERVSKEAKELWERADLKSKQVLELMDKRD